MGAFSSVDLLRWRFDGAVIPPAGDEWMYSGSVVADHEILEATYTVHYEQLEHQVRRTSRDAGLHWTGGETIEALAFVFRHGDNWFLLLAEPCSWSDWSETPASR